MNVALAAKFADENYKNEVIKTFNLKSNQKLTLLDIKGYQQSTDYTCAAAAVMSILKYYGVFSDNDLNTVTEMKISHEMGTSSEKGTTPQQIVDWLNNNGFEAHYGINGTIEMLQDNVKKGTPTLVEWIDWGGHWVVVAGYQKLGKHYSDDKDTIFFADPESHDNNVKTIYGLTPFNPDRFYAMWFDAQYFSPGNLIRGIYIVATPKEPK
jgi:predicted double-glycine peptidase